MKLDNLNKWLTLIANVGVLSGIVFLAIEVQQNSNAISSQTRSTITQNILMTQQVSSDPVRAEIMARGIRGELEPGINPDYVVFNSIFILTVLIFKKHLVVV